MVEYSKANVKLSGSQLNKLKSAVKNKQGLILRMNIKMGKIMGKSYLMNYY